MAQYTVLNHHEVQTIMSQYGVQPVTSFKVLSGGSENTNYDVRSSDGHFVLTICEQKPAQQAEELVALLSHLIENGLNTSKPVNTVNGSRIAFWNTKPVILKEFIEGDIIEDLSKGHLIALGVELAKLHQVKAPDYLPDRVAYGLERFHEVAAYAPESSFATWAQEFRDYILAHITEQLPLTLIHSDLFDNNVIVDPDSGNLTIMDYEEACHYYRIFDVGMTIVGTCCLGNKLDLQKAARLLKGYQRQVRLLEIEQDSLQVFTAYGAAATAFWRHQNFNHVNPDPDMKDHHKTMQELADHVRAIPAKVFETVWS